MTQIFQPGELIAERFEIVRLIAEGGMGQVYEALDRTLGGRVALKALHGMSAEDPVVRKRFRREIQLARQVTHPNVCRIYDVYRHRFSRGLRAGFEVTLVTMELLAGETLEDHLLRRGWISEEESLPIVRQIAAALDAAHGAGVIHRDLKPSNVMLVPSEEGVRAVVTDFGLARSMTRGPSTTTPLTGEMKVVGTADYMAPEQLRGEPVGAAADLYALGVVIFEMVTGQRPYSAPNTVTLLTRRATRPPSSPLEHRPDLDRRWSAIILCCLADDPAKRPSSAGELVELLAGEQQLPGGSPGAGQRRGSPALAVTAIVLVAGLLVILAWRQNPGRASYAQPSQLTTSPGLELDPAFSLDGERLAYSSDETGAFEIYVQDLDAGGERRRLTDDGGQNFEPAFSPDGSEVVYHSAKRGGLWAVPAGGGTPRQLSEIGSRPAFSPDGRFVAFQSDSAPLVSDNTLPALDTTTLWLLDLEKETRKQLTRTGRPAGGHGAPAFSPDGRRVAFSASRRTGSEIWSIGLDGREPLLLAGGQNPAYDPVFDPGGRRLYYTGYARQVYALYSLDLSRSGRPVGEGVQVRNLGLASLRQAAFASDASRLAFTALSTRSNLRSLTLERDGVPRADPHPLTSGTGRNTRPAFSNDGSRIAWERSTRGGSVDAWVMSSDGRDAAPATHDPLGDIHPSWLPDGRRLAFLRRVEGLYRLFVIDLESGAEVELAGLSETSDWARLSPDGRRVVFHSRGDGATLQLRVLDLASGEIRRLSHDAELSGYPCWSPDGRWIVFQKRHGEHHQIMKMASDGSGKPIALSDEPAQHYPYSFSPDGRKIAFAANRAGRWNLWWVEPGTGAEKQLTDLELPGGYVR